MAFLLVLVQFFLPMAAQAKSLSLKEAYEHALQYDAQYRSAEADTRIAKEEVSKAAAAFMPNIKAATSKGRSRTDSETPYSSREGVYYSTQSHSVSLRQPLFNLGSIASWKQAHAVKAKSEELFRSEHASLIVRTAEQFCNVLFSQDNITFASAQVEATKEQLEQSKKRFEKGFGTITEINEAQASFDLAVADHADAIAGLENSSRELERITGIYTDELCRLDPERLVLARPEPQNVEAWVALAEEHNGRIGAARQEVEITRKEIDKTKASRYPQLDLWAGRSYSVSENNYTIGSTYDTWSVNVQLSMPIYTGGYTSAAVRQAWARRLKAQEGLHFQERESLTRVRRYYQAQINSIAQVRAYEQAAKSAEIALEGTRKGFQAGFRTNAEVLDAVKKLYDIRRSLARARYQYILNRLMLRDAAGLLSESDLDGIDEFFVLAGS
ncbi:type I secretion outer membrane protein, TolC family [Chlorobaculum parvum NCIB 8327]|uniref:Type I secretion outer membrane protein, TolC family n=2 Tax=Chlorobaculum parvum TaxID=274539 RepID=B3QMV3_CHLP8|nr:type I secretion outer membrane protein, TolC family [Chlorobaculum parvum NCIB 8327]